MNEPEKNTFYITTPIYYVNDIPHIGHAYTSLLADVIARAMRSMGKKVIFLTGTDEHGLKVEKAANKAGMPAQDFTDKTSKSFSGLSEKMNFSNDDFIRTTEQRHKDGVKLFWNNLKANGYIYLGKYSGWYSVRDETFYDESELTEDKKAPTGADVEWIEEPSYFFALSKFQDQLLEFYESNPDFIFPQTRRNEVISFVKAGLKDLSISRTSFKWGIPVPGDESHVIYVWLDALTNYISALGYGSGMQDNLKDFWPADLHIVGKDILRFHAIFWPAFLMAADLKPPKEILAHGWWTNEGQKISKSIGNVINPLDLIEEFGIDYVRYFLVREVNLGNDGNYSREVFISKINSELANKIGNLVQRTCSFTYKNCDRSLPDLTIEKINELYESDHLKKVIALSDNSIDLIKKQRINAYLDNVIGIAEYSNRYIDSCAPWTLKESDPEKMQAILYEILETIRYLGILLLPIVPDSAEKILNLLIINGDERKYGNLSKKYALKPNAAMQLPEIIFPRI